MSLDGNPSFVSATAGSNSNTLTVGGQLLTPQRLLLMIYL